jgi:hypothetical protein
MKTSLTILTLLVASLGSAGAFGINLNLGVNAVIGGPPVSVPSSYAAAGTPGVWNDIAFVSTTPMGGFVSTVGDLIPMTITSNVPAGGFSTNLSWPSGGVTVQPEDQLLLGVGLSPSPSFESLTLSFANLPSGHYRVITYVSLPYQFPEDASPATVIGAPYSPELGVFGVTKIASGIYNGTLSEGGTHAIHEMFVEDGFAMYIAGTQRGIVTGMQIQQIPEPDIGAFVVAGISLITLHKSRTRQSSEPSLAATRRAPDQHFAP